MSHPRDVRLSGGGEGEVARMDLPGGSVAFRGVDRLPKPRLEGSRAVYADVRPGVDLVVEVNRTGFEQFWVIRDRPGRGRVPLELDLPMELVTEGVDTAVRTDGQVDVVDAAGTTLATLPKPNMWDASVDADLARPIAAPAPGLAGMAAGQPPAVPAAVEGGVQPVPASHEPYIAEQASPGHAPVTTTQPSSATGSPSGDEPSVRTGPATPGTGRPEARPVDVRVDKPGRGRTAFTFSPGRAFLDSPSTRYPVVVDPYVNAWTHFDTYVQSNVVNTDYSGSGELRLGTYDGGATVARSFLTMNLDGLQDKTIITSRLALWNWHSWSCERADWEVWWTNEASPATRWGSQPGWHRRIGVSADTQGYGSGACGDGWVWADITEATQWQSSRGVTRWGLGLKALNEGDNRSWKKFDSANAGIPPRLDVTYRNRPHTAGDLQISHSGFDAAGRLVSNPRPELSFVAAHPDGADVDAVFYVYEGSRLAFQQAVRVRSGERARLVVPDGVLKQGRAYKFRAAVYDDYTFGPDGWNRITPAHAPNKALDVPGCGVEAGLQMHQWDWNGGNCQRFGILMPRDGAGHHAFLARSGAGALDQAGCATTMGTRIITWYPHLASCQQFFLQPTRGDAAGQYRLLARNSGLAMDINGASVDNGAIVHLWGVNGCLCQEFRIDPAGDNGWESRIEFRTDFTAPGAPFVSSSNYPNNETWNGGAGTAGSFTVRPATGNTDVAGYEWGLDSPAAATNFVAGGGQVTFSVPIPTNGRHTLQVVARDHAGNRSPPVSYSFNVGRGGITQPAVGHHAVRRVRVTVDGDPSWTQVRLDYRRGEGATEFPVPIGHLTRPDGTGLTSTTGFLPLADVREAAIWDAGTTLGFVGGPVQLRATLRDASGVTYQTPWIGFTLDRDADGAATTDIGPGTVNVLTGDHVLSSTDAEEPGLSVSRTTSSRDPDSGLQPQREQFTANQAAIGTDTAGFAPNSVTVTRVADRGHSPGGALQVVPAGTGSTSDTFVAVGEGSGLQAGLQPGRRYRVSGWVFVPGATGLSPADPDDGLRIVVAARRADGTWTHARSDKAGTTDAWQQLSVDVTLPADATAAGVRLYSGFATGSNAPVLFDDLSLRQLWAPFGEAWNTGVTAEAAGTDYTRISLVETEVAQVDLAGGGRIWFTKGPNGWWPELGAEGLTLTVNAAEDSFTLTELDGTATVFRRTSPGVGDWLVDATTPPVASATTRYVYETTPQGVTRITRAVAPTQPGIDASACATAATPPVGCVVLEYDYAPANTARPSGLGDFPEQVRQVRMWTTDPATRTPSAEAVARYLYDNSGRLREVWDPRIEATGAPALKTRYEYDAQGRVTKLTPPGELPWSFTYGQAGDTVTGSGDWIDPNPGRLLAVSRPSLVEGTRDQVGPDIRTSVVYDVPTTRAAGGPYDLDAPAIATWGQTEAPTDATAVFGPETVPSVSTATASSPGSGGYSAATVHYLNAAGRAVNTASPAGPDAPVEGFIDTAAYDRFGNVVRTLEATNRLLALRRLPDAALTLGRLGLAGVSSAGAASALSSVTTYSPDGLDVLTSTGPTQLLAIGNDVASTQPVRDYTEYRYDEGKPDGLTYHLVTTETEGVKKADGTLADVDVTTNGYSPPTVCPGSGSGWRQGGQPTTVTVDAAGKKITTTVCYDDQGRAVQSRRAGAGGTDAGTVRTVFWTAGANPDDTECGGRPEWAGLPCVTRAAGPATGADTTRMAAELPVKRIRAYSRYGSAERVEESATGPVAGATATQTRTTVTTYDRADRVTSVAIATAGPGMVPVATTRHTYDPVSGDVTRIAKIDASGAESAAVVKTFDALGRMTRYDDGAGAWTATTFDRFDKPTVVTDSLGSTQRFSYDRSVEPRGFLTSVDDSVAGTLSAAYGPDGQVVRQSLPGQVTLRIGYDPAGIPVSRDYTAPDGPDADTTEDRLAFSAVVENGAGQYISHETAASAKTYAYDVLGRLTDVRDLTRTSTGVCSWRKYTWNDRAGRQSLSATRTAGQTCTDPATTAGAATTGYGYDSADRLQATTGASAGTYAYDPLGRITTAPVASNPGATVTNSYYANDLVAGQEISGVARTRWTLDALQRFSTYTAEAWANGAWANAVTKTNHYDSDGDSPAWIAEDATLPDEVTRYIDGLDGQLAVQTGKTGDRVLQLIDLHGDVMATLPIRDGAASGDWAGLRHQAADEFGNPTDLATGATTASTGAPPGKGNRYGWLGGAQRSSEALAGVLLMGVRLYDPATGRFWSQDPEPGGNATPYDYCGADPVNCTDLDGRWGWLKKSLKKVARFAEVASYIPGPIGSAASAISAGAYAATGNRRKAIEMGISAAAAMVPGGRAAVRLGAAALRSAGKVSAKAGRPLARASKPCNSFTPGTGVLMADGTTLPISQIQVGDLVAARDPITGETSAQPVLDVIVGVGDKHLIGVTTSRAPPTALGSEEVGAAAGADSWTATAGHPIWVEGEGWTDAEDLEVGDRTVGATGELRIVVALVDHGWRADQTVFNLSIANVHTYVVGDVGDGTVVHNKSCRQGGVYALTTASGKVVRTGRTNDLARRESEHGRMYQGLNFVPLARTNNRFAQRGLEQMVHNRYRPILNRVSPVSSKNPARHLYAAAAKRHLRGGR
ncbi:RICIN domain-containing protein [Geodermatophilus sp. DSM 45219]|uniref:RICIN domain-containing protein n=1 Tax=Geodermatophilus sp. DSM 45219 TaxID=1881103 RepID=UPI0015A15647|nr:RICIN domain-containing protein [Geodermatophilus sp. DSM 45219]